MKYMVCLSLAIKKSKGLSGQCINTSASLICRNRHWLSQKLKLCSLALWVGFISCVVWICSTVLRGSFEQELELHAWLCIMLEHLMSAAEFYSTYVTEAGKPWQAQCYRLATSEAFTSCNWHCPDNVTQGTSNKNKAAMQRCRSNMISFASCSTVSADKKSKCNTWCWFPWAQAKPQHKSQSIWWVHHFWQLWTAQTSACSSWRCHQSKIKVCACG